MASGPECDLDARYGVHGTLQAECLSVRKSNGAACASRHSLDERPPRSLPEDTTLTVDSVAEALDVAGSVRVTVESAA